jgi:hypothetical protein
VVLAGAEGQLLEGLVSNFFVIATVAAGTAAGAATVADTQQQGQQGSLQHLKHQQLRGEQQQEQLQQEDSAEQLEDLVLITNGPHEAALLGVTQQRVLQAAALLGLRVVLAAPTAETKGLWKEAFITNW